MKIAVAVFFFLTACSLCRGQNYQPDDDNSKVGFVIKNFGFNTGGRFTGLKGHITFRPEFPHAAKFDVTIQAATIDTDNAARDNDLRDSPYFDVEQHPIIRLVSTKIDKTNKTEEGFYYFTGLLVMKGTSKVITFPFEAQPVDEGYQFKGEFTINRLDFGIGEKSTVLSNQVTVNLNVLAKPR